MEPRYVITSCCNHKQSTKQSPGEIIKCSKCGNLFVEDKK